MRFDAIAQSTAAGLCLAPGAHHLGIAVVEQFVVADPRPARAPAQQPGAGHRPDP